MCQLHGRDRGRRGRRRPVVEREHLGQLARPDDHESDREDEGRGENQSVEGHTPVIGADAAFCSRVDVCPKGALKDHDGGCGQVGRSYLAWPASLRPDAWRGLGTTHRVETAIRSDQPDDAWRADRFDPVAQLVALVAATAVGVRVRLGAGRAHLPAVPRVLAVDLDDRRADLHRHGRDRHGRDGRRRRHRRRRDRRDRHRRDGRRRSGRRRRGPRPRARRWPTGRRGGRARGRRSSRGAGPTRATRTDDGAGPAPRGRGRPPVLAPRSASR